MAKIWRNRIVAGTRKFSDCPARWKEEVRALILADVESGELDAEEAQAMLSA